MTMKVCFTAAEMEPLAKVGGLADVAGALPASLRAQDIDIRVVLPLHGSIREQIDDFRKVTAFKITTRHGYEVVTVYDTQVEDLTVYLVDGKPIRNASSIYSTDRIADGKKFAFFSKSILPLCERLSWSPHIIHANDWHTSNVVTEAYERNNIAQAGSHKRTILTIHNLPFMGAGIEDILDDYLIKEVDDPHLPLWGRKIPLPMGISRADRCVAVSPTYADEIQTAEFGCGLEDYLFTHRRKLSGI
ncbi:MAG: glycogen/starch synthase, partial [Anaerolineae bacterium]|nr:glycogen/starch synthase [Anaerolineae bacterium]